MHDDRKLIEGRLRRALRDRVLPALYGETVPLTATVWHAPGEPVPFDEATANAFEAVEIGSPWGRAWATSWFRFSGSVPESFDGLPCEVLVDLGYTGGPGFTCEGLAYTLGRGSR